MNFRRTMVLGIRVVAHINMFVCISLNVPSKQKPICGSVCVQMYTCLHTRAHILKMYAEKMAVLILTIFDIELPGVCL